MRPYGQSVPARGTLKVPAVTPQPLTPDDRQLAKSVARRVVTPTIKPALPHPELSGSVVFVSLLRGCACLLVVWDHLGGIWLDAAGKSWLPLTLVRQYVTRPLAIIQDFGFFGVVLFFFVSGFIITHVSQRETAFAFVVKRIFRIYPPLIASVIGIVVTEQAFLRVTGTAMSDVAHASPQHVLLSMTLANYVIVPQVAINGVAWTLVIEVLFYVLVFSLLPLLKRSPRVGSFCATAICFAVISQAKLHGDSFFLFATSMSYVPLLLIGQVTYFLWSKRITWFDYVALLALNYLGFVYVLRTINTAFYGPANSYGVSIVYAYLVFAIAMIVNDRLKLPRVIAYYANISYSLYLFHGFVGFLVLRIVTGLVGYSFVGYTVAFATAFGAATGVTYVSYRLVERPSQHVARVLLKRMASSRVSLLAHLAGRRPTAMSS